MIIKEAIQYGASELNGIQRARYEAEILLCFVLGKDRVYLHTNSNQEIDTSEYISLVARRKSYEPIEYITKGVSFYSRDFFIDYGALIPRPETEILIDKALQVISPNDVVAEIGIGSGIISIMLGLLYPNATYIATDISSEAINIAKKNISLHSLDDKIEIFHTSLLDGIDRHIDMIVSNPPYIQDGFVLDKNLSYEPQNALFGGKIGDEILKAIIDIAYARGIKKVCAEMGYDQKDKIRDYLDTNYSYKSLEFYTDLASIDRGFVLII